MSVQLSAAEVGPVSQMIASHGPSSSNTSTAGNLNVCGFIQACAEAAPFALHETTHTAPARRIICSEYDLHDSSPVIREGWAAAVMTLSDGRRQILSFLLPGDMISTVLVFDARPGSLVETITEVRFSMFKRSQLKSVLQQYPAALEKLFDAWIEEKQRADQLITDLGRRTASERIARLILNLADRLARRGMTSGSGDTVEMEFPLRQHQIADATGLTPVHVSKVLNEFRRNGLIKISNRSLTILDPAGFRRIADMR